MSGEDPFTWLFGAVGGGKRAPKASKVDWEQLLGQVLGLASEGAATEGWKQLRPWMMNLGIHATEKWGINVMLSGVGCEVTRCPDKAIAHCEACGVPCCLKHCRPSFIADVVCERCVFDMVKRSREKRERYKRAHPPRNARAEARADRAERRRYDPEIVEAFETLGLPVGTPWDEVHAHFRKLSIDLHPDRHPEGPERVAAEKRFARCSGAYALLKQRRRKVA